MDSLLGICVGISLSAACGFRVFVPLLVMSAASLSGHLDLAPGFDWLGTWPALCAFSVATAIEITAYYVPWVDNLLDALAGPVAVVAGTVVMASQVTDMSPFLKWSLAIIAGGGAAGAVQGVTTSLRGLSSTMTGGFGNPILATAELGGSVLTSLLGLFLPIVTGFLLLCVLILLAIKVNRRRQAKPTASTTAETVSVSRAGS